MNRTRLIPLVVTPLLLVACGRGVHVEPPEVPVRPHVPAPEVPARPHVPAPAAPGEAAGRSEVNAEIRRLAGTHTRKTIAMACKINSAYEVLTGEWEDMLSEAASASGVPRVSLREAAIALSKDELSGDQVLSAAEEQLCDAVSGGA